ncbi:MAG: helix-turn-helix transcriptional regulator [Proteobacteria bacterium]|nr:helix-turn-helix transcriptional regulator [Pseudomonadota bacterium]
MAAAECLLREDGEAAVTVRSVAASIGVTDAAVNHHFGTREKLLEALLRHGGRQLREQIKSAIAQWQNTGVRVENLVSAIANIYEDGAYASLALRLHLAGWRDRGSGLLDPVVDALHALRTEAFERSGSGAPSLKETRFVVGMMHQVLAFDPLFGAAFRRSAGLEDEPSAAQKQRFWTVLVMTVLSGPATPAVHTAQTLRYRK